MVVFYLEVVDFNSFIKLNLLYRFNFSCITCCKSYFIACFQPLGFSKSFTFYKDRMLIGGLNDFPVNCKADDAVFFPDEYLLDFLQCFFMGLGIL